MTRTHSDAGRGRASWLVWACVAMMACVACMLRPPVLGERVVSFGEMPPAAGAAVTWLAVGDTGAGSRQQRRVAGAMARVAGESGVDFVTLLGDNFYPDGVSSSTDPKWRSAFTDVYTAPELQVPFYAILGNHDHHGDPDVQVGWRGDGRWRMPSRFYTFSLPLDEGARVQFFMLDTRPLTEDSAAARAQLEWLDSELASTSARWKIVAGHHTIHSGGKHGDDAGLHETLEPLLLRHGVDLYVNGHDHHLALMQPRCGLPIAISGAGSKGRFVRWNDETLWAGAGAGFALLRADSESLWIVFHGGDGEVRYAREIPGAAARPTAH